MEQKKIDISDNVYFTLDEINSNDETCDITEILKTLNNQAQNMNKLHEEENDIYFMNDLLFPKMINYNVNYTVKELLLVCDYYGLTKEIKSKRLNKEEIIKLLVNFESNTENSDIVFKRENMWFYINELKNDKFMKKYVLW
jgi:hypothetical protein